METLHRVYCRNARKMAPVADGSVDLVVTSPPYPMIEMWDQTFAAQNPAVQAALERPDGRAAFERMHEVLDPIWDEVCRILKPGGFACINIGDAVRKVGDNFSLYPNHARILTAFLRRGLNALPAILWRKQTNAPNKFMGSGMLPAGAYVTLEHEYVLIFRKGKKREFNDSASREDRRRSAYFWEERNQWFSDIWFDLKGTRQNLLDARLRKRSGAFPFELAYRLINMYSVRGDTVADPFLGLGTMLFAAMASARNSIGFEIVPDFLPVIEARARAFVDFANPYIADRIERHRAFANERESTRGPMKYVNAHHGFPVMTRQETALRIDFLAAVRCTGENTYAVAYTGAGDCQS